MLVRRLLSDRLARYYAQPAHAVVGSYSYDTDPSRIHHTALPFSRLWGEWHWKRLYRRLYEQQQGQWLTPVELFRPYYSNAIGNFIARTCNHKEGEFDGLEILEVGGGRGTNALLILNYLRKHYPHLYGVCRYTILDSSPSLFMLQKQVFERSCHSQKVSLVQLDLLQVAEGYQSILLESVDASSCPTFFLALEVLDNLPHDKVRVQPGPGGMRLLEQAEVDDTNKSLHESFRPLSDPLLRRLLESSPEYVPRSLQQQPVWVPTVACGTLLHLAQRQNPILAILLADFDWLPPPDRLHPSYHSEAGSSVQYVPGVGEPLVTDMEGFDHPNYLHAPECCDILFPTQFVPLATWCRSVFSTASVSVHSQGKFLQQFGGQDVQGTKSWLTGYSPLLHDFSNCSVLTVVPNRSVPQEDR